MPRQVPWPSSSSASAPAATEVISESAAAETTTTATTGMNPNSTSGSIRTHDGSLGACREGAVASPLFVAAGTTTDSFNAGAKAIRQSPLLDAADDDDHSSMGMGTTMGRVMSDNQFQNNKENNSGVVNESRNTVQVKEYRASTVGNRASRYHKKDYSHEQASGPALAKLVPVSLYVHKCLSHFSLFVFLYVHVYMSVMNFLVELQLKDAIMSVGSSDPEVVLNGIYSIVEVLNRVIAQEDDQAMTHCKQEYGSGSPPRTGQSAYVMRGEEDGKEKDCSPSQAVRILSDSDIDLKLCALLNSLKDGSLRGVGEVLPILACKCLSLLIETKCKLTQSID